MTTDDSFLSLYPNPLSMVKLDISSYVRYHRIINADKRRDASMKASTLENQNLLLDKRNLRSHWVLLRTMQDDEQNMEDDGNNIDII